jgi:periplasmic protein TonB
MSSQTLILLFACLLAGCGTRTQDRPNPAPTAAPNVSSSASSIDAYKIAVAQRISSVNSKHVHDARPQALLRSIVVLKFAVDADGNLVRSEILRSNRDRATEALALASLKNAAPFPKPASRLLQRGKLEMSESWLFNNDGRFQLRSVALPQMDE